MSINKPLAPDVEKSLNAFSTDNKQKTAFTNKIMITVG